MALQRERLSLPAAGGGVRVDPRQAAQPQLRSRKGAELYHRFIDEWCIAEDEGLEIMLNEHHQTATCVDPAAPIVLGALARLTKKARLLILGNPVANRRQPVRVAEEMAMVDVLSQGRLECGFVRGVPYEVLPANSNPVRMNERQWEAIDLIVKAWTHHDGPFSHEGRFFHHRNVNIWPRPYQQPHPPIWVSTTSPGGAKRVGARGYVQATFLTGFEEHARRSTTPTVRAGAKPAAARTCRSTASPMRRWSMSGDTEAEARAGAEKLLWYMTSNKVPPHCHYPPGYMPVPAQVQMLRGAPLDQHAANRGNATVDKAIEAGIMFAGTPDQVYRQIKKLYDHVGGFGHLLIMGQAGFLEHDETVAGIRCFARKVYPRLKEEFPDTAMSEAGQLAAAG